MDRAYKRLSNSDVTTAPFTANKQWSIPHTEGTDLGMKLYYGQATGSIEPDVTNNNQSKYLVYRSVYQLYYKNYVSASKVDSPFESSNGIIGSQSLQSGSYFNYPQSTTQEVRYFPTESDAQIQVIGIPRDLYGSQIKEGTFYITASNGVYIKDDSHGNLYHYSSSVTQSIGNIIYPHGMIIFTTHSNDVLNLLQLNEGPYSIEFQNTHVVYENVVKCTVRESELNYSQNPSISTDNSGSVRDFATGSVFTPYVTTVGLYNDAQELLAVAKMAQPVPLSNNTDTTFLINYDN